MFPVFVSHSSSVEKVSIKMFTVSKTFGSLYYIESTFDISQVGKKSPTDPSFSRLCGQTKQLGGAKLAILTQ